MLFRSGSLRIQNRDEGGAAIEIRLPKNLNVTENMGIDPEKMMVRKTS